MIFRDALSRPDLMRMLPGLLQDLPNNQPAQMAAQPGQVMPQPVAQSIETDQPPQGDDTRTKPLYRAGPARDMAPAPIFGGAANFASLPIVTPIYDPTEATSRGASKGFDYGAAMAAMMPQKPKSKGIFGSGLKWYDVAGLLGDVLNGIGGGNGHAYSDMAIGRRSEEEKRRFETARTLAEWQHRDYDRQNAADLQASQPFTLGRTRYQFDPATGQTTALQTAPMDFETYAASQGYQPGTPEYNQAAQDYILRGNGPTAVGLDASLDDHRTGNRVRLEGVRAGNRSALESQRQAARASLRSMPTYRDLHPRASSGSGGGIPTVASPQDAMKLPPGTKFRTPDGRVKVRP